MADRRLWAEKLEINSTCAQSAQIHDIIVFAAIISQNSRGAPLFLMRLPKTVEGLSWGSEETARPAKRPRRQAGALAKRAVSEL